MIKIKYREIIDGILALSALRGDVTGRGDMLVDNDEYALCQIVPISVGAVLDEFGLDFTLTKKEVVIKNWPLTKERLMRCLINRMLSHIRFDCGSNSLALPFTETLPYLRGWL